jgi:peptide chain release factor 2
LTVFDLASKKIEVKELKKDLESGRTWEDLKLQAELSKKFFDLEGTIKKIELLEKEISDYIELHKLTNQDFSFYQELEEKFNDLHKKITQEEKVLFLSGPYDKSDAILEINSGAGGRDAQDWAGMLLRMYQRYVSKKGWKSKIIDQDFGESSSDGKTGIKEAILEISGKFAYGFLKREQGVHRLVRISPFSAQQLRHTSFASVEVIPVLPKTQLKSIEIKPDDIKIDTYRASGPGGQYVNKRETAIRIIHIPTNITVTCQSERSLSLNKEKAIEILLAKIYQKKQSEEEKKIEAIKGKRVSPEWGNQIRSYILHPYKLVKDYRTETESKDPEDVLEGNLDLFIESQIKLR